MCKPCRAVVGVDDRGVSTSSRVGRIFWREVVALKSGIDAMGCRKDHFGHFTSSSLVVLLKCQIIGICV